MDNMTVKDLKDILEDLPDEMSIVLAQHENERDKVCDIQAFYHVRTAGILHDDHFSNEFPSVLCLNASCGGNDISTQIEMSKEKKLIGEHITCKEVLF